MLRKILMLLSSILIALSLSACSLAGLDARSLISPPTSNEDQQAIHNLLETYDSDLNFIYPKNGDYRSAIIIEDLNGDGSDEAIGFLEVTEGGISLTFMNEIDGEWEVVNFFQNTATQIYKVCFGDLDGNGTKEIIIGWGSPQSLTATISVIKYEDGVATEYILDHTYNEFVITDLDYDGTQELFTATVFVATEEEGGTDQNAVGRVFSFDEKPVLTYSCLLNNSVTKYSTCTFSNISESNQAVVLDGITADGAYISQLVTKESSNLITLLSSDSNVKEYNYFLRSSLFPILSQDIDGDGILEFPLISLQDIEIEEDTVLDAINYYVDWIQFSNSFYYENLDLRTIMNCTDNFMFEIDTDRDIYCYKTDTRTYTVNETVYFAENFTTEQLLFTIKIFTAEEWLKIESDTEYEKVFTSSSNTVCAVLKAVNYDQDIIDTLRPITE